MIYGKTNMEIAFILRFLERFFHSYSHDLHILVMQKLGEKTSNRGISFSSMKNQILASHAQLESSDTKLYLLAEGVAPMDSKSHYQSRFSLDSGEQTLDINIFMATTKRILSNEFENGSGTVTKCQRTLSPSISVMG